METVSVSEARKRLAELTDRVEHKGERIIIERHGKPVAGLVSAAEANRLAAEDAEAMKALRLAALERAREVRAQILAERGGVPLESSVETIRQMREDRHAQIARAAFGE